VAANGSDHHSKIGDNSFKGGFAPKCTTGQTWQKLDIWQCSGTINWDQEFFFPENIGLNEDGKERVGFFVMPYNFQTEDSKNPRVTRNTFSQAVTSGSLSGERLETLEAVCWKGSPGEKPSTFSESQENESWFSTAVSDLHDSIPSQPVPVFGELDMDQEGGDFTCEWHYVTTEGTLIGEEGSGTSIQNGNEFCELLKGRNLNIASESDVCPFRGRTVIPQDNLKDLVENRKNANGNPYSRGIEIPPELKS
jgi:hypothetical protein